MTDTILNNNAILLTKSQEFKEQLINNLALAVSILNQGVISRTLTTPPDPTPTEGVYIVATSATGAWTSHDNQIAQYYGTTLTFYTPYEGLIVWSISDLAWLYYHNNSWNLLTTSGGGGGGGGATTFTSLSDVLVTYSGNANKIISINSGATGLNAGYTVGTAANNLVKLTSAGKLPAVDGSLLTNLPSGGSGATTFTGLSDVPTSYSGNANKILSVNSGATALNFGYTVGTSANNIVQLTGDGKLPAVDGSLLTNLPSGITTFANLSDVSVTYSGNAKKVIAVNPGGTGLSIGYTVGTAANNLVQLTSAGKLPAVDGSLLTNLPSGGGGATAFTSLSDVPTSYSGNANKILSVNSGATALNFGYTVGTAANNIVQLTNAGKLPAVDGSLLTNLPSGATTFTSLSDVSVTYSGNANKIIAINSGATGLNAGYTVGTAANNIVQLTGDGKLPAVDGSNLTKTNSKPDWVTQSVATNNTTLMVNYADLPCDTSNNPFTVTLPSAVSGQKTSAQIRDVFNTDITSTTQGFGKNNLTVTAPSGYTVMGATNFVLNRSSVIIVLILDIGSTNWRIDAGSIVR